MMNDSDSRIACSTMLQLPRAVSLTAWSDRDWSAGVCLGDLCAMDRLTVTTRNSVYDIVIVSPQTGEVMVRGGALFPSLTPARLCGSSLGGSFLKLHVVHPGFCLELAHDERGIVITTPVRSVVVSASASSDSHRATM